MTQDKQRTILLIDDENVMCEIIKSLLMNEGYNVLTANDGLKGIEVFSEHYEEVDVVVMDMVMPQINGTDCFYELKDIDPDVKVIVVSGYSHFSGVEHLMRDGVKGFLQKPFSLSVIVEKLKELFDEGTGGVINASN